MIAPLCDKCGAELQGYGGLAFSPPVSLPDGSCGREVDKYHLCAGCWREFLTWLQGTGDFSMGPPPVRE
jgi:hypothetical protein